MFGKAFIAALFAGLAAAQVHAPVGAQPEGNPITRPLNEVVPAGQAFQITWQPTTQNPVSLVLLKGGSLNAVPISTIVSAIKNDGSYTWNVPADLEAGTGPTGYGIQLIDDITGQYQYSTQFGISGGVVVSSSVAIVSSVEASSVAVSSSVEASTVAPASTTEGYGGYPVETPSSSAVPSTSATPSSSSVDYPTVYPNSTSSCVSSTVFVTVITSSAPVILPSGTGYPIANTTVLSGTKPITVPASLQTPGYSATPIAPGTTPTSSLPAESTGGAAHLGAGMGLVGAVAAAFFML